MYKANMLQLSCFSCRIRAHLGIFNFFLQRHLPRARRENRGDIATESTCTRMLGTTVFWDSTRMCGTEPSVLSRQSGDVTHCTQRMLNYKRIRAAMCAHIREIITNLPVRRIPEWRSDHGKRYRQGSAGSLHQLKWSNHVAYVNS